MKKVGIKSMATTFAGCLLGAGYMSGQELWQYFGSFGKIGLTGLIISILIIAASSYLIMFVARKNNAYDFDTLLIRKNIPWLRRIVGLLLSALYIVVALIMVAGISSLGYQMLGIPNYIGAGIASVLLMCCVYFGLSGVIAIFEIAVPCLILVALLISAFRIMQTGVANIDFSVDTINPMLGSWKFSALNYATLNIFASLGIIAPISPRLKDKKAAPLGILIGSLFLIIIAIAIITALACDRACTGSDLPMLSLADNMGYLYGVVYAILLFMAMFSNGNATIVAATNYLENRIPPMKQHRILSIIIIGVLIYCLSLFGFSNLIAKVYPIIGYIGIASMILVTEQAIQIIIHEKKPGI